MITQFTRHRNCWLHSYHCNISRVRQLLGVLKLPLSKDKKMAPADHKTLQQWSLENITQAFLFDATGSNSLDCMALVYFQHKIKQGYTFSGTQTSYPWNHGCSLPLRNRNWLVQIQAFSYDFKKKSRNPLPRASLLRWTQIVMFVESCVMLEKTCLCT